MSETQNLAMFCSPISDNFVLFSHFPDYLGVLQPGEGGPNAGQMWVKLAQMRVKLDQAKSFFWLGAFFS